jgi:hypothetical protein
MGVIDPTTTFAERYREHEDTKTRRRSGFSKNKFFFVVSS